MFLVWLWAEEQTARARLNLTKDNLSYADETSSFFQQLLSETFWYLRLVTRL